MIVISHRGAQNGAKDTTDNGTVMAAERVSQNHTGAGTDHGTGKLV